MNKKKQQARRHDLYESQVRQRRTETEENRGATPLVGLTVTGYSIGQWCPSPDGTGPATAVAIGLETAELPTLYFRLKSRSAVDQFLHVLSHHRDEVFPKPEDDPTLDLDTK